MLGPSLNYTGRRDIKHYSDINPAPREELEPVPLPEELDVLLELSQKLGVADDEAE